MGMHFDDKLQLLLCLPDDRTDTYLSALDAKLASVNLVHTIPL